MATVTPRQLNALAHDDITVSTTAVPSSPNAILTNTGTANNSTVTALAALVSCTSTNPLRFRFDGTNPTASSGLRLVAPHDPIVIHGTANLRKLKFIREGGSDSAVSITYLG